MIHQPEDIAAIDAIQRAKARYWRGVDLGDGDLVRSVLAPECTLDYRGCCTDPASGVDHLPQMNVTLHGRDQWLSDGMAKFGIISVHQGHQADITITGPDRASAIWAFTDHMFFPAGAGLSRLTGHGFYHEQWVCMDGQWLIQTLCITRLRVEAS